MMKLRSGKETEFKEVSALKPIDNIDGIDFDDFGDIVCCELDPSLKKDVSDTFFNV